MTAVSRCSGCSTAFGMLPCPSLTSGTPHDRTRAQYLAYLVLVVSMSFVQSWLVNGSRGSVLLVILGHNGINWSLFTVGTLTGYEVTTNWPAALGSRSSPSSRPEADSAINSRKRKA